MSPHSESDKPIRSKVMRINWTSEQLDVIRADQHARLMVDAGPGTGKTEVLCARIAWLLDRASLEPGEIWIISFTRTAVAEIRSRIARHLTNPANAHALRVATIDAHAWAMNVGFSEEPVLSGSFDASVQHAADVIKSNEHALEYVNSVKHLFIDESQDVVGPRVEFVLELIHAMPHTSGITMLCDEAQAIYEAAEDSVRPALLGTLVENVRKYRPDFREADLTEVHRTADPLLCDLFVNGRLVVRGTGLLGRKKYLEVRRAIAQSSHQSIGDAVEDLRRLSAAEEPGEDTFLLFRRRGEALSASRQLGTKPHRLRMSGFPVVLEDWIAVVFWDWTEARMSKGDFDARWARRIPMGGVTKDAAWQRLAKIAGVSDQLVDVRRLRLRLASLAPPLDVCRLEFGDHGPVVGTIHAVKGRESREVRLYLPRPQSMKLEDEEGFESEARILFVGATRARERLLIGHSFMSYASKLPQGGRAYTRCANPPWAAEVEIGRTGDVEAAGLVGRRFFVSASLALRAQTRIAGIRRSIHLAAARRSGPEMGYAYGISLNTKLDEPLLFLSGSVNNDLFQIAKNLRKRQLPRQFAGLKSLGARTIALSPDDPSCAALHHPWSESGFVLAPLVVGYGVLPFK